MVIQDSKAARSAHGREANAIRWGRPEEARRWHVQVLRERALTLRAEAARLDAQAAAAEDDVLAQHETVNGR